MTKLKYRHTLIWSRRLIPPPAGLGDAFDGADDEEEEALEEPATTGVDLSTVVAFFSFVPLYC